MKRHKEIKMKKIEKEIRKQRCNRERNGQERQIRLKWGCKVKSVECIERQEKSDMMTRKDRNWQSVRVKQRKVQYDWKEQLCRREL